MAADFDELPTAVRNFRPSCPGCTPAAVTAADAKSCSAYDCPGLPAELRVSCELCMYDFVTEHGQVKCDHATCETAARLKANVANYRAWMELIRSRT